MVRISNAKVLARSMFASLILHEEGRPRWFPAKLGKVVSPAVDDAGDLTPSARISAFLGEGLHRPSTRLFG